MARTSVTAPVKVQIEPEAEKPKTTKANPTLAALENVTRSLLSISERLDALENRNGATVEPEPVETGFPPIKRRPGRPKGSTNKATAETTAAKPAGKLPTVKLTVAEAKALASEHWRRFGESNKAARVSVRGAVNRAINKLGADGGDPLSEFLSTNIGEKSGKAQIHYVAEAIAALRADLDS